MRYYQLQRQQDGSTLSIVGNFGAGNAGRITVRALESSLRLAEAHAKLMFHKTVTFEVGGSINLLSINTCSL